MKSMFLKKNSNKARGAKRYNNSLIAYMNLFLSHIKLKYHTFILFFSYPQSTLRFVMDFSIVATIADGFIEDFLQQLGTEFTIQDYQYFSTFINIFLNMLPLLTLTYLFHSQEQRIALDSEIFIALTYETLCMKNVLSYKHTLVPTILDKALLRVRSFLFIQLTVTEIITIWQDIFFSFETLKLLKKIF